MLGKAIKVCHSLYTKKKKNSVTELDTKDSRSEFLPLKSSQSMLIKKIDSLITVKTGSKSHLGRPESQSEISTCSHILYLTNSYVVFIMCQALL